MILASSRAAIGQPNRSYARRRSCTDCVGVTHSPSLARCCCCCCCCCCGEMSERLCSYFNTPAGCRHGDACHFVHAPSSAQPCRFFNSPAGCQYGDACRYAHQATGGAFDGAMAGPSAGMAMAMGGMGMGMGGMGMGMGMGMPIPAAQAPVALSMFAAAPLAPQPPVHPPPSQQRSQHHKQEEKPQQGMFIFPSSSTSASSNSVAEGGAASSTAAGSSNGRVGTSVSGATAAARSSRAILVLFTRRAGMRSRKLNGSIE